GRGTDRRLDVGSVIRAGTGRSAQSRELVGHRRRAGDVERGDEPAVVRRRGDRGVPGPGVRDGAGARAVVAGRRGDEDAGVERVEEGTVDEVAPRVLPAADREV